MKEIVVVIPSGEGKTVEMPFKTKTAYGLSVANNARGELVVEDITEVEDPKIPKSKRRCDTLAVFKEWNHWTSKP